MFRKHVGKKGEEEKANEKGGKEKRIMKRLPGLELASSNKKCCTQAIGTGGLLLKILFHEKSIALHSAYAHVTHGTRRSGPGLG